ALAERGGHGGRRGVLCDGCLARPARPRGLGSVPRLDAAAARVGGGDRGAHRGGGRRGRTTAPAGGASSALAGDGAGGGGRCGYLADAAPRGVGGRGRNGASDGGFRVGTAGLVTTERVGNTPGGRGGERLRAE